MLLEDSERVRAYVHPVRMHILSLLVDVPATVTQVANRLDVHPANITRHFRLLERVGLIELVEKRDTGRNLEKYYRAVARSFEVRIAPEQVEDARATALRVLRDDLSIAIGTVSGAGDEPAVGLLGTARLDRARIPELVDRLSALVEEFSVLDDDDGTAYHLSAALYPGGSA
jgi:DNA-binding transcriptional ArsR family regulator